MKLGSGAFHNSCGQVVALEVKMMDLAGFFKMTPSTLEKTSSGEK